MKTAIVILVSALSLTSCMTSRGHQIPENVNRAQRYPGENRLQFGEAELNDMLEDAYASIRSQAGERGMEWSTLATAASLKPVCEVRAKIEEYPYDRNETVRTDLHDPLNQAFDQHLNAMSAQDTDQWSVATIDKVRAICKKAGVDYPSELLTPAGVKKLRAAMERDSDVFEYMLKAQLNAQWRSECEVEFVLKAELMPLVNDADPIHAESRFACFVPIDEIFESEGGWKEWIERGNGWKDLIDAASNLVKRGR